jgi:hypothetical protein
MVIQEREFTPIKTVRSNIKRMNFVERQIYKMLKKRLPDAQIFYEIVELARIGSEGKIRATRPDFYIFRPASENKPEIRMYLEVTTSSDDKDDPKDRQKRIVKLADPHCKLVVLYRRNLEKIAQHHPDELQLPERKISAPKDKNKILNLWRPRSYIDNTFQPIAHRSSQ